MCQRKISFASLPSLVQYEIYHKLNYAHFASFDECSIFSNIFVKNNPSVAFPMEMGTVIFGKNSFGIRDFNNFRIFRKIPLETKVKFEARTIDVKVTLDAELWLLLLKFVKSASLLQCHSQVKISNQSLSYLMKEKQINHFYCHLWDKHTLDKDFLDFNLYLLNDRKTRLNEIFSLNCPRVFIFNRHFYATHQIFNKVEKFIEGNDKMHFKKFMGNFHPSLVKQAMTKFEGACRPVDKTSWIVYKNPQPFLKISLTESGLEFDPDCSI